VAAQPTGRHRTDRSAGNILVSQTVRVAIADDDPLVRAGIVSILQFDPELDVVTEAGNGGDLVRQVAATQVDVILLDVRMPGLDGLRTLTELQRTGINTPAAMLSTYSDDDYIQTAVTNGAKGFLLKSDAPDDLIRNIQALARGGVVFSPRVASWLIRSAAVNDLRAQQQARTRIARLNHRQRAILDELTTGANNAEIADRLHLTEGTIKQYLRQIYQLLAVENRVQAAILGHQARC
jgi:DNA-binding NarL/FixJ family response regulator